ncbi:MULTISPECIES: LysR substrate-binding domain-containing protein [Paenibacillus]|uniref:LysR family transcriptional regulator n=1 Tax=Paenibacillus agri TaxID=2744309 RepID=A0A850EFW6_9BACL|nr:LysR substrate-binding domain-containing protein [Paenibacillus agri]NUU60203.1 LysR family transcriptional regulator [Paenibacillus agri]
METRHLHYFLALCEELHFTRAAEQLGISQPTLSQQIRVLEGELNMPLFDRIGKKIALTEAGVLLKAYASRMIQDEQNAKNAINELRSDSRGTIRLGLLPSDLDYRLTPLLVQFHQEFPNIRLQVYATTLIRQEVLDNKLDIGISLKGPRDPMLVEEDLGIELYQLVIRKDHPYADREHIELSELPNLPLVMYPRGLLGRELVEDCFREAGLKITPLMETGSATSVLQLVKAGIGGTIQPASLLNHLEDRSFCSIPIINHPPQRELRLIYRTDRFISHATGIFIDRLRDFLISDLTGVKTEPGLRNKN